MTMASFGYGSIIVSTGHGETADGKKYVCLALKSKPSGPVGESIEIPTNSNDLAPEIVFTLHNAQSAEVLLGYMQSIVNQLNEMNPHFL